MAPGQPLLATGTYATYAQASRIRAQLGHSAAKHHYRQLLLRNPYDTSAATRIAAADDSMKILAKVGWPYSQLEERLLMPSSIGYDWEDDTKKLNSVLKSSNYHHSVLREHVFNLHHIEIADDEDNNLLRNYKHDYPMGPSYARPLVAGDFFNVSQSISVFEHDNGWLRSLQCLAALFLLASSVPRKIFVESVIGGEETLELMMRLGIVFLFDEKKELNNGMMMESKLEEEWVVPLVHLFPLEIPSVRSLYSRALSERNHIILMTDLHPSVLGVISIEAIETIQDSHAKAESSEGAVMYIGPDSLALVQHLHASLLHFIESSTNPQSPMRVLDICTGSGVQALAALAMLDSQSDHPFLASTAVAIDVNERAIRFTTFNAHLNGFKDRIRTIHADILSGKAYRRKNEQNTNDKELEGAHSSLVGMLLKNLEDEESKFDILLANPPFIPVPSSRSDCAASKLGEVDDSRSNKMRSFPRYGLFSSGGASGEECLCALLRVAPSLLKSDGGLLAIVSEFMNPPPLVHVSKEWEMDLITRIEKWWIQQSKDGTVASGILFTNENAISADVYAGRRAAANDMEEIKVWKDHLRTSGISSVSPGLLFIQRNSNSSDCKVRISVRHHHVPTMKNGSIWTPHNFEAVNYTRNILMGWLLELKTS